MEFTWKCLPPITYYYNLSCMFKTFTILLFAVTLHVTIQLCDNHRNTWCITKYFYGGLRKSNTVKQEWWQHFHPKVVSLLAIFVAKQYFSVARM